MCFIIRSSNVWPFKESKASSTFDCLPDDFLANLLLEDVFFWHLQNYHKNNIHVNIVDCAIVIIFTGTSIGTPKTNWLCRSLSTKWNTVSKVPVTKFLLVGIPCDYTCILYTSDCFSSSQYRRSEIGFPDRCLSSSLHIPI